MFLPNKNTPRWVIFTIDVVLTIVSLSISYLIRFDFVNIDLRLWENEYQLHLTSFPIFIVVRALLYYFSKTYAGIIRYTSTEDTKRLFSTVSLGTLIFLLISFIKNTFYDSLNFLPISILITEYLVTLFLLLTFRITVKLLYVENKKSNSNTIKTLIYGAGKMGIITKNTIDRDASQEFEIVGFIDDNKNKMGKMIERCPIIGIEKLSHWVNDKGIKHVIIAIKNPIKDNKRALINESLKNKLKISTVPPVEKWLGDSFNVKQIQKINIESVDVHPDFNYTDGLRGYFDIAVINIASDIRFNDFKIQPFCLPDLPFVQDIWYDKNGIITGYSHEDDTVKTLARTEMTIFSNTMCNGFLNGQLDEIEKCK